MDRNVIHEVTFLGKMWNQNCCSESVKSLFFFPVRLVTVTVLHVYLHILYSWLNWGILSLYYGMMLFVVHDVVSSARSRITWHCDFFSEITEDKYYFLSSKFSKSYYEYEYLWRLYSEPFTVVEFNCLYRIHQQKTVIVFNTFVQVDNFLWKWSMQCTDEQKLVTILLRWTWFSTSVFS